jgi:hypothetical protein
MTTAVETEKKADKAEDFGQSNFRANAIAYARHKRVIDALATEMGKAEKNRAYGTLDDAIRIIRDVWSRLENQTTHGTLYTPPKDMGFGSSTAAEIAGALLGKRTAVGEVRKAFAAAGKT